MNYVPSPVNCKVTHQYIRNSPESGNDAYLTDWH